MITSTVSPTAPTTFSSGFGNTLSFLSFTVTTVSTDVTTMTTDVTTTTTDVQTSSTLISLTVPIWTKSYTSSWRYNDTENVYSKLQGKTEADKTDEVIFLRGKTTNKYDTSSWSTAATEATSQPHIKLDSESDTMYILSKLHFSNNFLPQK